MELYWLRLKLGQWGRRCRAIGLGYPTMSSHEQARIGRGGAFTGPTLPPDLEEIDYAVTISPPNHKMIIVECYTKEGTRHEHAARLYLSEAAFYARKKKAEVFLYQMLKGEREAVRCA
jgi:hypothetical protein